MKIFFSAKTQTEVFNQLPFRIFKNPLLMLQQSMLLIRVNFRSRSINSGIVMGLNAILSRTFTSFFFSLKTSLEFVFDVLVPNLTNNLVQCPGELKHQLTTTGFQSAIQKRPQEGFRQLLSRLKSKFLLSSYAFPPLTMSELSIPAKEHVPFRKTKVWKLYHFQPK